MRCLNFPLKSATLQDVLYLIKAKTNLAFSGIHFNQNNVKQFNEEGGNENEKN